MKISLNWLQEFIRFVPETSSKHIADRLSEATAEVERIHNIGEGLDEIVIGKIKAIHPHPKTEKLFIAELDCGAKKSFQAIFGQKASVHVNDLVALALAPTELHGGKVEKKEILGVLSEAMLCLDSELIPGMPDQLTKFPNQVKPGSRLSELMPIKDTVFEIDNHSITHRPDLFSHYGFCRELVALGLAKWKKQYPQYDLRKLLGKSNLPFSVSVSDERIFSNYHATMVEGLDTRKSPQWMQLRLNAVGIRPINAIVDITNYVMMETGAPMHAFDKKKVKGEDFVFRLSKKGEVMNTLDGKRQELDDDIMIVESSGKIVDLVGIMGGEESAIDDNTKAVFYHQGIYNPVLIRKGMMSLGHRTDAGTIFEKGIDSELSSLGLARTLELTKEIFPESRMEYKLIHIRHKIPKPSRITLTKKKLSTHSGIDISLGKAAGILQSLGFLVKTQSEKLLATPPSWRSSGISIPEDLVEEIVRIYGYSRVKTVLPQIHLKKPDHFEKREIMKRLRNTLVALGFLEQRNFSFLSGRMLHQMGISLDDSLLRLKNPVSEDFEYLRPTQLIYLIQNAARDTKRAETTVRTFELGKVYTRHAEEAVERYVLSILITGDGPHEEHFYESKEVLGELFTALNRNVHMKPEDHTWSFPGRSLSVVSETRKVGNLYQLHPAIGQNFHLTKPLSILEIGIDDLLDIPAGKKTYTEIIRFPQAKLDLSVVVSETVSMEYVLNSLKKVAPEFLKDVELTDLYRGDGLKDHEKSFTFALTYQAKDRTLDETEISSILQKLIRTVEEGGGVVRR